MSDNQESSTLKKNYGGSKPSLAWSHFDVEGFRDSKSHRRTAKCKYCQLLFPSARLKELKKHVLIKCPNIPSEYRRQLSKELSPSSEGRTGLDFPKTLSTSSLPSLQNSSHQNINYFMDKSKINGDINGFTTSSDINLQPLPSIHSSVSMPNLQMHSSLYSSPYDADDGDNEIPSYLIHQSQKRKMTYMDTIPNHQNSRINPQPRIVSSSVKSEVEIMLVNWFATASIPFDAIDHPCAVRLFELLECPRPTSADLFQLFHNSTIRTTIATPVFILQDQNSNAVYGQGFRESDIESDVSMKALLQDRS